MHLDDGNRHRRHRVAQRHRGMGISPGVEHHTVVNAVSLLYGVDQLAFDIGLEVAESAGGIERPEPFEEGFEGLRTVNSGVAPPLQIEVRAVENQYFHSSDC